LLFIVTAALGESLGETVGLGQRLSEFEHGSGLASEITQTPLVVQTLPDAPSGRTNELIQSIDLVPTLLEWFGASPERFPCDGASLRPLLHGGASRRTFICLGDGPAQAIRTPDRLLVTSRDPDPATPPSARRRLYVLPEDRWQINDVAAQSPDDVERLEQQLQEFTGSLRQS
jgi:arylsulfatase A-like enzyme